MPRKDERIGPFILEEKLGGGGFGVVWRAHYAAKPLEKVALKIPHEGLVDLQAVQTEAQVWAAASGHENVLAVRGIWPDEDNAIIISEYAPDKSLHDWLAAGRRTPQEACRMLYGVLAGLEHLHTRAPEPIVHRDLKPGNVLLCRAVPKLADFGLARIFKDGVTRRGMGTPAYMALEAFNDKYEPATDIWAAGVMFYQMLTLRLPFAVPQGMNGYQLSIYFCDLLTRSSAPCATEIPAPLWAVLERALAREPVGRPTAAQMRVWLEQAAAQLYGADWAVDTDVTLPDDPWAMRQQAQARASEEIARRRAAEQSAQEAARRTAELEQQLARLQAETAARFQVESQARQRAEAEAARLRTAAPQTPPPAPRIIPPPQPALVTPRQPQRVAPPRTDTVMLPGNVPLEMVLIPAGKFMMGSESEKPIHEVTISRPFYLGKCQVTQAQWKAVMNDGIAPSGLWARLTGKATEDNNPSRFKGDDLPVEQVSWEDVQEFCRKLGPKYRLPTEAEWEYACRAGTTGDYAGNVDEMAWYDDNAGGKTHPVGQKKANGWGLYDMHGNVWEWCQDWYGPYSAQAVTDPQGPTSGSHWVNRGGSWNGKAVYCRSARRYYGGTPVLRGGPLGFRLSRTPA